jgi:hypothetical protein
MAIFKDHTVAGFTAMSGRPPILGGVPTGYRNTAVLCPRESLKFGCLCVVFPCHGYPAQYGRAYLKFCAKQSSRPACRDCVGVQFWQRANGCPPAPCPYTAEKHSQNRPAQTKNTLGGNQKEQGAAIQGDIVIILRQPLYRRPELDVVDQLPSKNG